MNEYNLFYYPYASITNVQLPLLKVAALYFDKFYILDPVGASWDTIGADYIARDAITRLKNAGILEIVTPASVLAKYKDAISNAIRRDMQDSEFLELCKTQSQVSGKQRWTLSLEKVPEDLQTDHAISQLMGDFARSISSEYEVFDEYREGYDGGVEYRYADFPLALGEAIMMNHALFTGLLHIGATPITDDPFHSEALSLKLSRAVKDDPLLQQVQAVRKPDLFAVKALTDLQLNLPILNPMLPLEVILEYRNQNKAALQAARDKLGRMTRRIESEPWSEDFVKELEHKIIPDLADELDEARQARDAWLVSQRGRLALNVTSVAAGAATAILTVFTAPITPIALATAGLGLLTGGVIPGTEFWLDWRNGKKTLQENGLYYLLQV